ncbi:MAG: hypothetical protein AAF657_14035 [Acidobacteriota bacterium]
MPSKFKQLNWHLQGAGRARRCHQDERQMGLPFTDPPPVACSPRVGSLNQPGQMNRPRTLDQAVATLDRLVERWRRLRDTVDQGDALSIN